MDSWKPALNPISYPRPRAARRPALTQPTPALRAAHRTHPGHEQLRVLIELDPLNNGLLHTQKGTP